MCPPPLPIRYATEGLFLPWRTTLPLFPPHWAKNCVLQAGVVPPRGRTNGPTERREAPRSSAGYSEAYGVGFKLLRQAGWKDGEGLGREGQVRSTVRVMLGGDGSQPSS